jgi:hypothetical protein
MRIGVLSDTHGWLDSRVIEVFGGVERILHAGDVGTEEVLLELGAVAPVTAVRGNTDGLPLSGRLRESESLDLDGLRVLLIHQVGDPERPAGPFAALLEEALADMVIFGHTHAPFDRVIRGRRFLNPGGAGARRFRLPRTVALLEVGAGKEAEVRFIPLDDASASILKGGRW